MRPVLASQDLAPGSELQDRSVRLLQEWVPWSGQVSRWEAERFRFDHTGARNRPYGRDPDPFWYLREPTEDPDPAAGDRPFVSSALPDCNEEYFEHADAIETAHAAGGRLCVMELGANYGRWCVIAASAHRRLRPDGCFHLLGIEGVPVHYQWMRQHFADNAIPPSSATLINGAVWSETGCASFDVACGDQHEGNWRGQSIGATPGGRSVLVRTYAFRDLLMCEDRWDLIDVDVQGAEITVLGSAIGELDARVRKVHVGTHGPELEAALRVLFDRLGWIKIWDYPTHRTVDTYAGRMEFVDGVQTWMNPRFL